MDATRLTLDRMPWWEYVETVTGRATNTAIGARIGVTGSSVGRWITGSLPDPGTAARFAREYGRPVLEAFVAAGYLTPEEAAQRPTRRQPITTYGDDELVREVARRIREGGSDAQAKPTQKSRRAVVETARADEATEIVTRKPIGTGPQSGIPGLGTGPRR